MVGQGPAQSGAGDDVPEAEGPDTVQRCPRVGTEGFRCGVADLLDRHQRHRCQVPELVQFQEFLGAAHDGGLQAVPVGLFFQVEGVPLAGDGLDRRVVVGTVQERQSPGLRLRVGVQQLDPPPVPGRVHVGRHERVRRVPRCTRRVPVEQFPFLVVERAQPVRHPPQVQGQVLPLTGAIRQRSAAATAFAINATPPMVASGHGLFRMGSFPVKVTDPPAAPVVSPTVARTRSSSRSGSSTLSEVSGAASTRRIRSPITVAGSGFLGSSVVTAFSSFLRPDAVGSPDAVG